MNKTEVKITVNGLWEIEDIIPTKPIPLVFGTAGEMGTQSLKEIFRGAFEGVERIADRERNITFMTNAAGMEQFDRAIEEELRIQRQGLAGMRPQQVVLEECGPFITRNLEELEEMYKQIVADTFIPSINPITKVPDKYERLLDETDLQYLDRISEE